MHRSTPSIALTSDAERAVHEQFNPQLSELLAALQDSQESLHRVVDRWKNRRTSKCSDISHYFPRLVLMGLTMVLQIFRNSLVHSDWTHPTPQRTIDLPRARSELLALWTTWSDNWTKRSNIARPVSSGCLVLLDQARRR